MNINSNIEERYKVEIKALEAECLKSWQDVAKWMKFMLYASLVIAPLWGLLSELFNDTNFAESTLIAFCVGVSVPWLFINLIFGYYVSMRLHLLYELKYKRHVPDMFSNPSASNQFSSLQKIILGGVFSIIFGAQYSLYLIL
jgi:ABC-type dipeptide/oligopeptide/nickel transport system permease component